MGGAVDIARTASPRRVARRAKYPSAPQWLELTTPTTQAPLASAPSAARSTPARAPRWPMALRASTVPLPGNSGDDRGAGARVDESLAQPAQVDPKTGHPVRADAAHLRVDERVGHESRRRRRRVPRPPGGWCSVPGVLSARGLTSPAGVRPSPSRVTHPSRSPCACPSWRTISSSPVRRCRSNASRARANPDHPPPVATARCSSRVSSARPAPTP